jgi:hypothetical protein
VPDRARRRSERTRSNERPLTWSPSGRRTRAKTDLWAACIAGAIPERDYLGAIESAGLSVVEARENEGYRFISERAIEACSKHEVKGVSLLAVKR